MKNTELEQNHFSNLEEVMNLQNTKAPGKRPRDRDINQLGTCGLCFYLNSILFT